MSRSKQHTPVTGVTTARSEKEWKRDNNRKLRSRSKQRLGNTLDPDALVLPLMREVSNVWSGPKDGRQMFDPQKHPKLMRK